MHCSTEQFDEMTMISNMIGAELKSTEMTVDGFLQQFLMVTANSHWFTEMKFLSNIL